MESDGTRVDRRCNTADHAPLILAHDCKEVLIQFPAKAAFSILRMHAYKVNIGSTA